MRLRYKQFEIDASCLAEGGRYFARAKVFRPTGAGEDAVEVKWSGDIGEYRSEEAAVEAARQWAIQWCDENGQ